jgi:hypothetical protein
VCGGPELSIDVKRVNIHHKRLQVISNKIDANFYPLKHKVTILYMYCTQIVLISRAATAGKAGKNWSFPKFWDTLTLSQPGGAD